MGEVGGGCVCSMGEGTVEKTRLARGPCDGLWSLEEHAEESMYSPEGLGSSGRIFKWESDGVRFGL